MPAARPLPPDAVHLWRLALDLPPAVHAAVASTLTPDEQARTARYHFEADRRHFAAARGQLRQVLATYIGGAPAQLLLTADAHGKPHVDHDPLPAHFNLAHSGAWALLAVSRHWPVGVDLERLRPEIEVAAIAQRFFAPAEAHHLAALPAAAQERAFFRLWTRKEAYVKARGQGLSLPLDEFEVSLEVEAPRLLWVAGNDAEPGAWTFFEPSLPPGYLGALAVRARAVQLEDRGVWPAG